MPRLRGRRAGDYREKGDEYPGLAIENRHYACSAIRSTDLFPTNYPYTSEATRGVVALSKRQPSGVHSGGARTHVTLDCAACGVSGRRGTSTRAGDRRSPLRPIDRHLVQAIATTSRTAPER